MKFVLCFGQIHIQILLDTFSSRISRQNLIKDQNIFLLVIVFKTFFFDYVDICLEEIDNHDKCMVTRKLNAYSLLLYQLMVNCTDNN